MTSSTSSSDPGAPIRFGGAVVTILPFAAIYVVCNVLFMLWAAAVREPYVNCNEALEPARILAQKSRIQNGYYPKGYDILFAGTSRTNGDVSASIIADRIGAALHPPRKLKAYNLGFIGRSMTQLNQNLRGDIVPAVLVFELHPVIVMNDLSPETESGVYERYRRATDISNLYLAGYIKKIFRLQNIPKVGPLTLSGLKETYITHAKSPKDLYYYHINRIGYCQKLLPDGQITYRNYLKGRESSKHLRVWFSPAYEHTAIMGKEPDAKAYRAFELLVKRFAPEGRLVVVRMPTDPEMYRLENQYEGAYLKKAEALLARYHTPVIDMNPHDYLSSDTSHLDWYDTRRFSRNLAGKLLTVIDWEAALRARPRRKSLDE